MNPKKTNNIMAGEHIKDLLPFEMRDVRILLRDGVGEISECTGHFADVDPFLGAHIIYPPIEYQITAKRVFEFGEDAQRIVSLLSLANGLSHRLRYERQDSDEMVKIKKMIDTMLMSVEYVLKQQQSRPRDV